MTPRLREQSPADALQAENRNTVLAELARRAGCGDRLAFRELYDLQVRRVTAQVTRIAGPGVHVEDIVQEVFVRIHRSLAGFEERSSVSTWIFGITHHTTVDWIRHNARAINIADLRLLSEASNLVSQLEARDHLRILNAALDDMSVEAREAFVLHEIEGFSLQRVAELVDAPLFTVAARIRRARESLARLLDTASNVRSLEGAR